jgi:L-2-hydroxyglutarate oxidase
MFDYAIIGAGIVGLSTATALGRKFPDAQIVVLDKEEDCALHQTGRNSGVIHSGIYYKPGSLKAQMCRDGNASMAAFCDKYGIPYEICGKLIVATEPEELPELDKLYNRGIENSLPVTRMSAQEVAEIEPHVQCIQAIYVRSTGICDYRNVCSKLVDLIRMNGGEIHLGARVERIVPRAVSTVLETQRGTVEARVIINCGGLQSDRLARAAGLTPSAKIVPFRGEYYQLVPEKRPLIKGLVYPVPNPKFPFLGVHFTRMIDGSVHAGPNAVLSLKREGYSKSDFSFRDTVETMTYPGFWKLARKHAKDGFAELHRSFSKAAFVRSLQRLVPEIQASDIVPCEAGVRAQALTREGGLVDDFMIVTGERSVHVCNAPSPAATSSLEIGRYVAREVASLQYVIPTHARHVQ